MCQTTVMVLVKQECENPADQVKLSSGQTCLSMLSNLKQFLLWSSIVRFKWVSKKLFLCSYTLLLVRHPKSSNKNISYWGKTCCHVGGTNLFKVINECHIFSAFLFLWVLATASVINIHCFGISWNKNLIANILWCFDVTFMPTAPK